MVRCKDGEEKSLKTGKCVIKCKPPQTRNPATGRCKNMGKPSRVVNQVQSKAQERELFDIKEELKTCLTKRVRDKTKIKKLKDRLKLFISETNVGDEEDKKFEVEDDQKDIQKRLIFKIDEIIEKGQLGKMIRVITYTNDNKEGILMAKLFLKRFKFLKNRKPIHDILEDSLKKALKELQKNTRKLLS